MCRFVAYSGNTPIVLKKLLGESPNSLIIQSRLARESSTAINADGYGVGWYDKTIMEEPAIFKSIQPAWNDKNLLSLASIVKSNCFVGHVRASTQGDVTISNCHPFAYKNYLFAHNGTIQNFNDIKKNLVTRLDKEIFLQIKGQTDSEHFFFLVCNFLQHQKDNHDKNYLARALAHGIREVHELFDEIGIQHNYKINTILTDGKILSAMRYNADLTTPTLSLYYSDKKIKGLDDAVVVASEHLTNFSADWDEVPENSILTVDEEHNITIQPVNDLEPS